MGVQLDWENINEEHGICKGGDKGETSLVGGDRVPKIIHRFLPMEQ